MAQLRSAAPPPVVLGVALTIVRPNRARPLTLAARPRPVKLTIDPSLELLFLCEATLSGQLECLGPLTHPGVVDLRLRAARLLPLASGAAAGCPLTALASGQCFITAGSHKALVAGFTAERVRPEGIELDVQSGLNLLDYLRAEQFTVELSGTQRRRFHRPLALRLYLELETRCAWLA